MPTKIEWTDETWNPVTGCTKVSPGCKNCYAEGVAKRFWAHQYLPIVESHGTPPNARAVHRDRVFADVQCHPERLDQPLRWRKPRKVFVCSMSDLFHEAVPGEYLLRVFDTIRQCPHHTMQILTKRSARMLSFCKRLRFDGSDRGRVFLAEGKELRRFNLCESMKWLHLGVSCENQEMLDQRVPDLLATPAAWRFLSLEPVLGPVDLRLLGEGNGLPANGEGWHPGDPDWNPKAIDRVIVGGESGPGARPCDVEGIRSVVEQCKAAGVACFVKQDSGPKPGMQGRIPDELWVKEEMPER